jgi:hypothetical protein
VPVVALAQRAVDEEQPPAAAAPPDDDKAHQAPSGTDRIHVGAGCRVGGMYNDGGASPCEDVCAHVMYVLVCVLM